MYKLELKKKGKIIKSVDDWYNAAPPKNPSLHWKDGRSAKELAKYMTSTKGYMPKEIENILTKLGCNTNITFYGEPEAVTSLEGRGDLQDLKNFVTSLGTPLEDGQYNLPVYPDIDFYVEYVEVEV